MSETKHKLQDRVYVGGLIAIALSLLFYCLPYFFAMNNADNFGLFIPNFVLAAGYFLVIWANGYLRRGAQGIHHLFLFLILFFISAWALNREMNVFEESTPWFAALMVLSCVNYVSFAFYEQVNPLVRHIMLILLGISGITFLYLSAYLFPLYVVGAIAFFVIGISLHVFVPVLFIIYTIVLIVRIGRTNKNAWILFSSGCVAPVIVAIVFSIQWAKATNTINDTYRSASLEHKGGLPGWVAVAQKSEPNSVTEKAIKSGLVYALPETNIDNMFWRMPSRNFGEKRLHDPLVTIATMFGGFPEIDFDDRIKLLEILYNKRHEAEERLWSGDNLYTERISTDVKIWPQFCLSYTEKKVVVTNDGRRQSWRGQQEGIYTFDLPEGAVITSLSLWIEGKEEKAILTSRQKADSAYKTIVGVESRDPSVVHWKEGNRVSVRVFPVLSGKSRMFKIGITSPLQRRDGKMVYENVTFKGPSASEAEEEISVHFEQPAREIIVPAVLQTSPSSYQWKGKYRSDWTVSMSEQPISREQFSFNGKSYSIHPYELQHESFNAKEVYLDINKEWTKQEFAQVWEAVKGKKVYAWHEKLLLMDEDNHFETYYRLAQQPFSLFPFHEINDPSNALLITKNNNVSPNLSDLDETYFGRELKKHLAYSQPIRLFSIGNTLSPYLKTLKEYRTFQYECGSVSQLVSLLEKNEFAKNMESNEQVVLDNTGILISSVSGDVPAVAPDHLMRLFAYNHIMQQRAKGMFGKTEWDERLVKEAQEAYVVTPVSSLVVLESKADYDRFNIKDSNSSLKNAAMYQNGSVPEPHEWALILLGLLVLGYLRYPGLFKRHKQ